MRISNNMINNTVVFNMQRSLSRFLKLQTSMSSGRRINKPSDDPIGIQRDLGYRTELAKNTQYRANIEQAQSWMQSYDSILGDSKDLVSSAKEIAVAMANGVYDDVTRAGSATEVDSIFDRLMQLSNGELEGRYIFSGHRTTDKSLSASATGVVYRGDQGKIDYQIESSARMTVNLTGSYVFLKPLGPLGKDADLDVGVTGSTLLADLHNGGGIDQTAGAFVVTDNVLGISATIDLTGATTVDDAITAINTQLAAAGITNMTAKLGEEGNNLLLDTSETGLISTATPVSRLRSGNGIDLQPGQILVSDGLGVNVNVDLSGSETVGDIITKFNDQMSAAGYPQVTMGLAAAGTGLEINDASGVLGLQINDTTPDESTAIDLGIVGEIGPTLVGTDLQPKAGFSITETTGSTAADLGLLADIEGDYSGSDLDPQLLTTNNVADLNHGLGIEAGRITINHGDLTRTIDLSDPSIVTVQDMIDTINSCGLDITASLNDSGRGIQIVNNDDTRSLIIKDEADGRVAKEMGLWGSSDIMGSIMLLAQTLRADDQEGTGLLLQNMDDGMQHLLNVRASVGARDIRLEDTHSRLTDLDLSFTDLLSQTEDADLTQLVTDLATFENNYKSSLMASAKIIQPSLLDFLG